MQLINMHTHTNYCDGQCSAEEMIQAAIKCNFQSIGISTHGPVPFDSTCNIKKENVEKYIDEVNLLKEKYKEKIKVLLGMEMDYIPGIGFDENNKSLIKKLDYYIGSVHFLGKLRNGTMWAVDGSIEELQQGIIECYGGNVRHAVEAYYNLIAEMAINYEPPIIGHIDLIKKFNKNNVIFNENDEWYRNCVEKCLNIIKFTSSTVEINTGGIARGYLTEQYPSKFILESIKDKDIPIIINSDAHTADGIDCKFNEMYKLIQDLGFHGLRGDCAF